MKREEAIQILETQFPHDHVIREALATVIPEFRESKNEKIRKEIINYLDFAESHNLLRAADYEKKKGWITYLEKQKELFGSGKGLYYYDGEKTTYCGYPATEENPYDFAMSQQKEQKPTWSEEDEEMITNIISSLRGYMCVISGSKNYNNHEAYIQKEIEFLNALRPSWRPSKEQMEALEKAIVRSCSHQYGIPLSELYEQLKKL